MAKIIYQWKTLNPPQQLNSGNLWKAESGRLVMCVHMCARSLKAPWYQRRQQFLGFQRNQSCGITRRKRRDPANRVSWLQWDHHFYPHVLRLHFTETSCMKRIQAEFNVNLWSCSSNANMKPKQKEQNKQLSDIKIKAIKSVKTRIRLLRIMGSFCVLLQSHRQVSLTSAEENYRQHEKTLKFPSDLPCIRF